MLEKNVQVVVIDKTERLKTGVVNHFNRIKCKIGTYSIDKVEKFARKVESFLQEFGIKVFEVYIDLNGEIDDTFDRLFDKVFDYYDSLHERKNGNLLEQGNNSFYEEKRSVLQDGEVDNFSFDKLEPMSSDIDYIIDDEDDITELKELKKELLMGNFENYYSDTTSNTRRGSRGIIYAWMSVFVSTLFLGFSVVLIMLKK